MLLDQQAIGERRMSANLGNIPVLETKRLLLRAITAEDRQAIFGNFSDPDVANWFFDKPLTTLEQTDEIIRVFLDDAETGKGFTWAILLKEDLHFLGTCSYSNVEPGCQAEIGFDLAKEYWGRGFMVEALRAVIEYGFRSMGLEKIVADTYSHNLQARRVLEKLNFQVDSIENDAHIYVLLRKDWSMKGEENG